jgi:glycosyltransferase involved in cell wall biosynthesis
LCDREVRVEGAVVAERPRISVLLPVYNGGPYLDVAVRSVLAQTFADFELLAIDDGSTDGSLEMLRSYEDHRVRVIENGRNLGIVETLNRGLSLAGGEFVARMDSDDISLPGRFERQAGFLDAHPGVGVVGTSGGLIDGRGEFLAPFRYPLSHEAILFSLHFFCPLAHPSVMMRREVVLSAGGYRSAGLSWGGASFPEDYDLWWRLGDVTRLANLPDRLLLLRKHPETLTARRMKEFRYSAAAISRERIGERLGEDVPLAVAEAMMSRRYEPPELAVEVCRTIVRLHRSFMEEGVTGEAEGEIRREACEELARVALYRGYAFQVKGLLGTMARLDPTFRHAGRHLLQRVKAKILKKPLPY